MMISCLFPASVCKPHLPLSSYQFLGNPHPQDLSRNLPTVGEGFNSSCRGRSRIFNRPSSPSPPCSGSFVVCGILPVDPWAPTIDSQSIASQLFAASLLPYLGFLYFITKSRSAPKLTLFGFYFLLAFVGATIPAGIYAKVHYGTSLSNVDWLHGGAESLLTLTNLFIIMGLMEALRKEKQAKETASKLTKIEEEKQSSV
ncbi:hypothetical protein CKAN_00734700 [Cinnamomum micranthum f. kanehirae]|uniref:1-acyl-sn-glycerol-3-phosphate acyltransferase delta n=1 Tax=Cinnamomum micranthum f. kanehirae TaxID=337451 RepID=A0A443NJU2_9MAGN|nr:hypothetical protein CKAN_00734700 [Cinnamomum micranthum f. kanehirae]